MAHAKPTHCVACNGRHLFRRKASVKVSAGVLVRLMGIWKAPHVDAVVCADCGHVGLYAGVNERRRLLDTPGWERVRG